VHRLREVRWPARGHAATEFARSRLAALADAAGPAVTPGPKPARWRPTWRLLTLASATPFAALGAVTVVRWLVG
jgi:hypothetical protein